METLNRCQICKYYQSGVCVVPLWVEGQLYGGRITKPEKTCDLFETSDALMTMEEESCR